MVNADAITTAAQALSHPVRVALIRSVRGELTISPSGFSAAPSNAGFVGDGRSALSDVAYHTRALRKLGVLTFAGYEPGGRGERRVYRLADATTKSVAELVEVLKGYSFVMDSRGEARMFNLEDSQLVVVGQALVNPTRLAIVRDMCAGSELNSPAIWVRKRGGRIATVAYHFRVLAKMGVFVLERIGERRGGKQHFYELNGGARTLAVVTTLDLLEGRLTVVGSTEDAMFDSDGCGPAPDFVEE